MRLPNPDQALIDIRKLRDYSLNLNHRRGKHKARLFLSILGLRAEDAIELEQAIRIAIQTHEAIPKSLDQWGQRYQVDFPLQRGSAVATIRTTWIISPNEEIPRLTSC
ncbi:MAG: DUF6883 domain-containing protein [Cyanobacteria bacterium J06638_20]